MFRIEIFVEDKNVAKALHALNGMGHNLSVLPVGSVESPEPAPPVKRMAHKKVNRGPDGKRVPATRFIESLLAIKRLNDDKQITTSFIQDEGKESGYSKGGLNQAIMWAIQKKLITRTAQGTYEILPPIEG